MAFLLLTVFAILGLALYGFINFCFLVARATDSLPKANHPKKPQDRFVPDEIIDVRGAERLLNHWYLTSRIDEAQYNRIRDVLEQDYEDSLQQNRLRKTADNVFVTNSQTPSDKAEELSTEPASSLNEPVVVSSAKLASKLPPVHPLDADDELEEALPPRSPAPHRSLAEMMAGFMEKRNIRWGELASGLLIVGSAVGLVISLREELRDRIPYFSALVFMLITAAIHGAGTYTLRRWKLRNTSRGVLLIGMLLIPLNFLAACLLNGSPEQQRSLTDPLFWIAVTVGTVAYSAMSWFSTRNLFQIRHLGTAICVVTCGVAILAINRAPEFSNSIAIIWLLTFLSFATWLVSLVTSAPKILQGHYASLRFRDRLLTIAGIGLFSVLTVVAMLLIRGEDHVRTLLTLTPLFGSVGVAAICVGDRLFGRPDLAGESAGLNVSSTTSLIGRSIYLTGWIVLTLSIVGSMFHPRVTLAAGGVVVLIALAISARRRVPGLATSAWTSVAATALVGAAITTRRMPADSWSTLPQLADALSHSQSGIALMLTGAIALLIGVVRKRQTGSAQVVGESQLANLFPKSLRRFSVASIFAGVAVAVGVAWLTAASLLHRHDWLDVNIGTVALMFTAIGGLILNARQALNDYAKLGIIAALALAGCHLLGWNPFFSEYFTQHSPLSKTIVGFDARLISLLAVCAILIANSSFFEIRQFGAIARNGIEVAEAQATNFDPLRMSCWLLIGSTIITALLACPFQSYWTIGCLLAVGVANGLLLSSADPDQDQRFAMPLLQVLQTLILSALTATLLVKKTADPYSLNSASHAMLQFGVLSITLAIAHSSRGFLCWGQWKWLAQLVAIVFLGWFTVGVGNQCFVELVAGYRGEVPGCLDLSGLLWRLVLTSAVVFWGQLLIADPVTKTADGVLAGLSLVAMGAAFAIPQVDAHAVASACRWLVPIGVGVVSVLIGSRKLLPDRSRSLLMVNAERASQQKIIDALLLVAVIVVLGISTIGIARFLVIGGQSLGGPLKGTWFGNFPKDVSFGGPVGLIVATFLWYAITERRSFLAMAGSAVFQYIVLLSIVLLFFAVNPKLASQRFINILQATSVGMTGYGLVWLWQRPRIGEGTVDFGLTQTLSHWKEGKVDFGLTQPLSRWKMLDAHAIINVTLVLSLVVLIFQRYFFSPLVTGDWITAAGSPLGIVAAVFVSLFAGLLWKNRLRDLFDLVLMLGCLSVVAFVAAAVDRATSAGDGFVPWSTYRILTCGSLITVGLLLTKTLLTRSSEAKGLLSLRTSLPQGQAKLSRIAIGVAISISFLFCSSGVDSDAGGGAIYLAGSGLLLFAMACHAYFFCSWFVGFAALPMVWIFTGQLMLRLGAGLHDGTGPGQFDIFLAQLGASGIVAAGWTAIDWVSIRVKRAPMGRLFLLMPNLVVFFGSILAFGSSAIAILIATESVPTIEPSRFHLIATLGVGAGWIAGFWNRKRFLHLSGGLLTVGAGVTLAMGLLPGAALSNGVMRATLMFLAWAVTLLLFANVWARLDALKRVANHFRVVSVDAIETRLHQRLPIWILVVGCLVFLFATIIVCQNGSRAVRVTASFAALTAAASLIVFSLRRPDYPFQLISILASVAGFVLLSLSGTGVINTDSGGLTIFLSGLFVPALSVFVFGVFATRWLRVGDSWEESIRDATAALTVITFAGAVLFLSMQYSHFNPRDGSGLGISQAVGLLAVLLAMILGLLMIAIVPKRDPFSLSLEGRQGYVYAAQAACVVAAVHLYLSMPWLLQTGILQYWPYLAIAVSMVCLVLSDLLKRRGLEVLSEPIFRTAAMIPVFVAVAYWSIDSKANAALTFLLAGLIYLGIAVRLKAIWSGMIAMMLGNISLWLFYSQQSVGFTHHPQLWLIPPAVCVLLGTWLERRRFPQDQLTAIRYACVFVIYLSSTSEILINGISQQIWPPLVLAVLSIAGMAAGIMLRVRSFLFVGFSFLFVSMIAMVSHAQQRLHHVWPWWAFGILMGAAILVMFGLFEKRRNDLIQIGKRMREWDG